MSKKYKHKQKNPRIIPRPEGYTVVKYDPRWEFIVVAVIGSAISFFLSIRFAWDNEWLRVLLFLTVWIILFVVMRRITEVKVNLKITEEGIEQTKLSGLSFYPECIMIKWADVNRILFGRGNVPSLIITFKNGKKNRMFPSLSSLFEKQKCNFGEFCDFRDDLLVIAPKHGFRRESENNYNLCRIKTQPL